MRVRDILLISFPTINYIITVQLLGNIKLSSSRDDESVE